MNQSYFAALVGKEQPGEQDKTPRATEQVSVFGSHLEVIVTIVMVVVFLASSWSWRTGRPSATLASTSNQDVVVVLQDALDDNCQVASSVHPSHRR